MVYVQENPPVVDAKTVLFRNPSNNTATTPVFQPHDMHVYKYINI